ncbi:MAG: DUF2279 domain-containing protein [Vicingus serpentipes]|nr:DUF2279 domain-containing protein [Vicingus serpentipes]
MVKKGIIPLFILLNLVAQAQQDTLNTKRLKTVIAAETIIYSGAMTSLYQLWYKDVPSSSFHFFNDNQQWNQMDKIGHGVTSYYIGKAGYEVLKWSGIKNKKAIWYGGTLGLFFLTSVEIFDGYSSEWGFSWGDVAVNTAGSGLFIGQQLAWNEQRVLLKYSFHQSDYWQKRPNILGETLMQQTLKDYNGQTYWLSANIASFLGENNKFPKWLNFAIGYGADGMLEGTPYQLYPDANRIRQYYISLDVDLTRIKTKSKIANALLGAFGFIKFPMPAVEFNSSGVTKVYGFYF